ncbi:hypothetical protein VPH35_050771 [Triticum aestivum]
MATPSPLRPPPRRPAPPGGPPARHPVAFAALLLPRLLLLFLMRQRPWLLVIKLAFVSLAADCLDLLCKSHAKSLSGLLCSGMSTTIAASLCVSRAPGNRAATLVLESVDQPPSPAPPAFNLDALTESDKYHYADAPSPTTKRRPCTTTVPVNFVKYPFGCAKFDYMVRQVPLPMTPDIYETNGYNYRRRRVRLLPLPLPREQLLPTTTRGRLLPSTPHRTRSAPKMHASKLQFCSGVVRIRSTTSVCLLHGLVLLPIGISVAGADDTSIGDATELRWELNEDLGCCYVSFHVDQ